MPCTKCKDSDTYKWGKTGECEYATKEACESANHKYSKMNPTPLGKKTYAEYEKELKEFNLSKVERVELGMVDEIIKKQKDGDKLSSEASGQGLSNLRKAVQKADRSFTLLYRNAIEGIELVKKVEKATKELGIDLPKEVQGALNNFKSWESDADYWIDELNADQYN
jgi:hypothetical protein